MTRLRRLVPLVTAVCIGTAVSAGLFAAVRDGERQRGLAEFERRADGLAVGIEGNLRARFDVLHGIAFLTAQGITDVGLVGHSFGAAVVITAGVASPHVKTVVSLSAQTAGAQGVRNLAPKSILLVHGTEDIRLSPQLSQWLYQQAREPKKLVLLEGARHSLRQSREELRTLVREWLVKELADSSHSARKRQ